MGSLVHDIIYVEKYTLEIAHEKIYEDKNRPVMCGIVSIRHRIFLFSGSEMLIYRYMSLLGKIPFHGFVDGSVDKGSCTFSHSFSMFLDDGTFFWGYTNFYFNESIIVFLICSSASF